MRASCLLCLGVAFLSLSSLHALTGPIYHSQLVTSSITAVSADYRYPGARTFRSVRDVDFANMRLVLIYSPYHRTPYRLENGQFSLRGGVSGVTGPFQDESAHCCPDAVVAVTFKWDGSAFQVQNVKKQSVQ